MAETLFKGVQQVEQEQIWMLIPEDFDGEKRKASLEFLRQRT